MKTKSSLLVTRILLTSVGFGCGQLRLQCATSSHTVAERAGSVALDVTRTDEIGTEAGVNYAAGDGTAASGLNDTATNGTPVFITGEISRSISVPIANNGLFEGTGAVTVTLGNAANADVRRRVQNGIRAPSASDARMALPIA